MTEQNPPSYSRATLWSLRLFHFFYFMGLGITIPLITIWYKDDLGFNGYQLALLTAVAPLGSVISQNLLGLLVDHLQSMKRIVMLLLSMGVVSLILLYQVHHFWSIFGLISLFAFFNFPIISILNSSLMHYFGTDNFSRFGDIRSFGTMGFLFSAFFLSRLLPEDNISIFFLIHAGALFLAFSMVPFFPPISAHQEKISFKKIVTTLNNPLLFRLGLALVFQQIAFSAIDNYVSLYILEQTNTASWASLGWGVGTVLEIFVIRASGNFVNRFSIRCFILIGIGATMLRLFLFTLSLPIWTILLVQISHSLAFSGSYLGAVYYIGRVIPVTARTSSQSLYDSFIRRGGLILGAVINGIIYENFGLSWVFGSMGGLSLLSFVLVFALLKKDE